ncbi:5-oxoprolinase subunit PxpB [Microbulbifer sp. SAOS-129_SWC]|uniref:5-oxoprolinase subunit PxpB n=1 Tax=Microbulbifer sp. SAOS-129_SWC TaxID=3145235 RepID=UPI0032180A27
MLKFCDSSDESITIYVADTRGEAALARVTQLVETLRGQLGDGLTDLVPSYCSVTVYYDVRRWQRDALAQRLRTIAESVGDGGDSAAPAGRSVELPVYYGIEAAPDLQRLAAFAGMDEESVIALHSGTEYRVYALGFRPGFAFMGMVPEPLRAPRLENPRPRVPAGSVAVADAQTAVYPDSCPGGWNLLGRCPLALFERDCNPPRVLLQVGDRVRFAPVTRQRYLELGGLLDD